MPNPTAEVTISREHLEVLLWFAKRGDVAASGRPLRRAFRHTAICSEAAGREPECFSCQAFAAAEMALED
jgi:hypothetical protein